MSMVYFEAEIQRCDGRHYAKTGYGFQSRRNYRLSFSLYFEQRANISLSTGEIAYEAVAAEEVIFKDFSDS